MVDYQTAKNIKLTFDLINERFLTGSEKLFRDTAHERQKQGELNNNTVHKRFSSLKSFMRYIEKELYNFKHTLYKYKIKKFSTDFVLNRDEIRLLEDLKIDNPFLAEDH